MCSDPPGAVSDMKTKQNLEVWKSLILLIIETGPEVRAAYVPKGGDQVKRSSIYIEIMLLLFLFFKCKNVLDALNSTPCELFFPPC